jgi:hypothetical protein
MLEGHKLCMGAKKIPPPPSIIFGQQMRCELLLDVNHEESMCSSIVGANERGDRRLDKNPPVIVASIGPQS